MTFELTGPIGKTLVHRRDEYVSDSLLLYQEAHGHRIFVFEFQLMIITLPSDLPEMKTQRVRRC